MPEIVGADKVLCTREHLSYDESLYILSRQVETRYWFLLGCRDDPIVENLKLVFQDLADLRAPSAVVFTGAYFPEGRCYEIPRRFGFLSTYIFNSEYVRRLWRRQRSFYGWAQSAIFLMALGAGENLTPIYYELALEGDEEGSPKSWTGRGGFLAYQISLARLVNWLAPQHPCRSDLEQQAVGRWPLDLVKALLQGYTLSPRDRRFVRWWVGCQGGVGQVFMMLIKQLYVRYMRTGRND